MSKILYSIIWTPKVPKNHPNGLFQHVLHHTLNQEIHAVHSWRRVFAFFRVYFAIFMYVNYRYVVFQNPLAIMHPLISGLVLSTGKRTNAGGFLKCPVDF